MGFWNFFRTKKEPIKRVRRRKDSKLKEAFDLVKADVDQLNKKLDKHSKILSEHSKTIEENIKLIKIHSTKLRSLESLIKEPISRPISQAVSRPTESTNRPVATKLATGETNLAIDNFSLQEKKILGVFLENKDMALSYIDIAKTLKKSPNTIKNQLNQIRRNVDLFDISEDNQRNRFKLKRTLKIEKALF